VGWSFSRESGGSRAKAGNEGVRPRQTWQAYRLSRPPSMTWLVPVTKAALSEQR
jgi:hypothetical protein